MNGAGDKVLRNEDWDEPEKEFGYEPGNDTGVCSEVLTAWEQPRKGY